MTEQEQKEIYELKQQAWMAQSQHRRDALNVADYLLQRKRERLSRTRIRVTAFGIDA